MDSEAVNHIKALCLLIFSALLYEYYIDQSMDVFSDSQLEELQ